MRSALDDYAAILARRGVPLRVPVDPPGVHVGRYRGRIREFDLDWDEQANGYRRRFEPKDSRVVWFEGVVYSAADVRAKMQVGEWRKV